MIKVSLEGDPRVKRLIVWTIAAVAVLLVDIGFALGFLVAYVNIGGSHG